MGYESYKHHRQKCIFFPVDLLPLECISNGNAIQEKNFQNNGKLKLFNYIPSTIKLTIISSHKKMVYNSINRLMVPMKSLILVIQYLCATVINHYQALTFKPNSQAQLLIVAYLPLNLLADLRESVLVMTSV